MDFGTQQYWPDGTNIDGQNNISARNFIKDLSPGSSNNFLVGVVISKLSVHSFPDKKNPGNERYSLGFTLRDSPTDFVNVTCWGNEAFITGIAKSFRLNDIVEVRNPQVSPKQNNEYEHQWKPWTPSNFQLNVSEAYSTVSLHTGWDLSGFNLMLHTPIKESGDYCTLADILSSGQNIHGDHMNVLVAVKNVSTPKDIVTKRGKQIQKCDIQIFDETCRSFLMTLWDEERIELALTWTPCETVLFIADLKIIYDDYRKTMTAVGDNKAIITVNPDIRQAHQLYSYAQSPEVVNGFTTEYSGDPERRQFSLDGIKDMFTLDQIKEIIAKDKTQPEGVTGIVYAYLTNFNIDGNVDNVLALRCTTCRRRVNSITKHCENAACHGLNNDENQLSYDLCVDLSDHFGTLRTCRLLSSALETMLGYSPEQFKLLPSSAVIEFKMKYLLERCKFYFKISSGWSNSVLVLSCTIADPEEAFECTKI